MFGSVELVLSAFAILMAVVTAVVIKWSTEAVTALQGAIVVFLLLMMAAMFGGVVVYYLTPGTAGLVEGLWLAAAIMSVSAFVPFAAFLRETKSRLATPDGSGPLQLRKGPLFSLLIGSLVLANEFLMGWAFSLASGVVLPSATGGAAGLLAYASAVVTSPWFLFTMAGEMGLTLFLLRARVERALGIVVAFQAAIMFLSPPALANADWVWLSVIFGSGGMIALFVYVMEHIYRHKELNRPYSSYLVRVLAVYSTMMAGLFLWLDYGTSVLFAGSIVLEMFLYFDAVVRLDRFRSDERVAWQLNANWAFQLLSFIFIAELFMGAYLDLQLSPGTFRGILPTLTLSGAPGAILSNALSNGFWFFAIVAGSTWFLAMMGAEMGALVAFKFREVRNRETKARLLLMMGCYGLFAVFFPSIYYSSIFPNWPSGATVPVLGWSMGLGAAGIAPSLFLVILATYAITGGLSVMFGRRVICSTFCTAPLMYQGTAIDSMKSFNRTSPIARKYLGSRFSTLYSVTNGVVMTGLVGTAFLSYFDTTGRLNLTVGGTDPSVFLFLLSFNVLWYVMFVTIPYTGNYNCVTMGWCYTGTIAQAFQKIGFYKLKVRDRQVCKDCTTVDCAKACPVGLVDMPGFFRTTGEYRSSKCCGVGNCVGACPYGNLYIHDIRHWLRRAFHRPEVPEIGLPMVRPSARLRGTTSGSPPGAMPVSSVGEAGLS
ncbi:MAG: hypothetical protein L3K14_00580 [Thermoplasmata archaeon]|nr:hypothetical protein [Thermoplasmata archaeon]